MKELTIDHSEISDVNTITKVNEEKFAAAGLDIHLHEVKELTDDHVAKKRTIKIKNTKFFGPWKHRG